MPEPTPNHIYTGDCLEIMRSWPDGCIDHCIADPPFGIASGRGRKGKKGLGWAFSSHVTMQEAWDQFSEDEYFQFSLDWLKEVCRVVRPNGNILVFGTFHNIYLLGYLLGNVLDRRILNSIVWFKPNAQPNITARMLTESTEQIIWAVNETPKRATKWTFNYRKAKELNGDKQMRNMWFPLNTLWKVSVVKKSETAFGKHPSQKPTELTDRLVAVATAHDDLVLDPFAGAGGVALSALRKQRRYVLIERDSHFSQVAKRRLIALRRTKYMKFLLEGQKSMSLTPEEVEILTDYPVPQADDLDLVFKVAELVDNGTNTRRQIAAGLDYATRQGPYYADAAMALGLVQPEGPKSRGGQRLILTTVGQQYLAASIEQRGRLRREIVCSAPVMKYIASNIGVTQNGDPIPEPAPEELLDEARVSRALQALDTNLSESTASRRAKTICSWIGDLN